jgi:hypothetical protein
MTSIIDPTALLDPDRPNPTYPPAHTAMAGRLAAGYEASSAPTPTKVTAVDVRGSSLVLTLAEGADKAIAESPENYLVTINGGNHRLPNGSIQYNPVAKSVTLNGIPFSRGDHVSVTVLGLWDRIKNIPRPAIICGVQIPKRSFPGRTVSIVTAMVVALLILLLALLL